MLQLEDVIHLKCYWTLYTGMRPWPGGRAACRGSLGRGPPSYIAAEHLYASSCVLSPYYCR